jgi:asparagine synthase (glutamine-hydrolysing)
MFAIAVWDAQQRALTLVRDRLGKKPLYVYREPGLITFASELKALFAGPSFDRSIDRSAVASYLRYLCVPSPRTIFERAIKLDPAHLLTVSDADAPRRPATGRSNRSRVMGWHTRSRAATARPSTRSRNFSPRP